ncbi:ABC transporter ATP-binding protein [Oligosphaera ethanolica]|uniref:ATP-binding cassette subfamily B protein n=1 Tax=Oligosphaera ethanolica TaxID=760260 RepID=A0AAE3VCW1_9BACT|nr:ABC transporter ATP-binding protein [Oligosphaera ethanolica]MDQ0288137.1 ATP-binding cassette subfamily B protein [Oligosphaera ethanolica]NLE54534.1 ABC transporter ATP-binding protein [Lentisphaerota bacterium]
MKKLLRYMAPYRRQIAMAPIFMIIEVALELLQPRFMARIIDDGVGKGDLRLIWVTCLLMLGTSALAVIGGAGCTYFSSLAGQNFGADLRQALFRKVMSLSFAETDRFTTASLITRLTQDVGQVQHMLVMSLRMLVRQPLMCLGGVVMALLIDIRLAGILLLLVPPILFMSLLTYRYSRPMFSLIQEKVDRLNAALQENLAGIRVVKAYGRSDYEKKRFERENRGLSAQHLRTARFMSGMMPLTMLIMNMGILAVLYTGGWTVRSGELSVGEVMAMVNYITQILFSFMFAAFVLTDFSRAKASADRITAVMDTQPSVVDPEGAAPVAAGGRGACRGAAVEFRDVSFRYPGAAGAPVLQGVSFAIRPGETVAVLGSTGSGKSTLAHLLPRFYDATGGAVVIDGRDVRDYHLSDLRDKMSMVLQESVLFSGTVAENIRWGEASASQDEVEAAARAAQVHDFVLSFKDGYETLVGQRGITLSGGQKQRLAIARALLKKPSLLILDDSTSAIDGETEGRLHASMKEACGDMSILQIAQRISSVCNADRIVVLQDGVIVGQGRHADLLRSCRVYQEIVESQTGEDLSAKGQNGGLNHD